VKKKNLDKIRKFGSLEIGDLLVNTSSGLAVSPGRYLILDIEIQPDWICLKLLHLSSNVKCSLSTSADTKLSPQWKKENA